MPPWDFTIKPPTTSPIDALNAGSEFMGGLLDARAFGLQRAQALEANKAQESRAAWEFQQKQMLVAQAQAQAQQQALAAKAAAEQAAAARAKWQTFGVDTPVAEYEALIRENPQALSLPGFSEMFKAQSDGAKQQFIVDISEPIAFLKSGQKQLAVDALSKQQVAYENAGDMKSAASRAKLAETIEKDPDAGFRQAFALFASGATKEQMDSIGRVDEDAVKLRKAQADADKAAADAAISAAESKVAEEKFALDNKLLKAQAAEIWSKIDLAKKQFGIDKMKAQAAIQKDLNDLPTDERKAVGTAVANSRIAEEQASAYALLGDEMGKFGLKGELAGKVSDFSEGALGLVGAQTEEMRVRRKYRDVMGALASSRLPPGSASNADVALAMAGFPPANSAMSALKKFMNMETAKAARGAHGGRFDSQFRARNNGPGDARSDIVIDGVVIPKGTSMVDADQIYRSGRAAARSEELAGQGLSVDDVEDQLKREGY